MKVEIRGHHIYDLNELCQKKEIDINSLERLDDEILFEKFGDIDEHSRAEVFSVLPNVHYYTGDPHPLPQGMWYTGSFYAEVPDDKAEEIVKELNEIEGVDAWIVE